MTAALTDPVTRTAEDTARQCDCRYLDGDCIKRATWVYRMKCCAGSTFVCRQCRTIHGVLGSQKVWQCRWCRTRGTVSDLVAQVVQL